MKMRLSRTPNCVYSTSWNGFRNVLCAREKCFGESHLPLCGFRFPAIRRKKPLLCRGMKSKGALSDAAAPISLFENLFTVDVIFNDEPNIIIISCFNLVQREIACEYHEKANERKDN